MAKLQKKAPKTADQPDLHPKSADPKSRSIAEIEKKYGKNAIMTLTQDAVIACDAISTGEPQLDLALGVHGVPRGRVIEIFGPESSGKTTLTLHIIASAQKAGGTAAFIDAEHALDPDWARRIGVKVEDLLVSQPDNGEAALDIVEILVRGGGVDVVVVDSVAALVPRAEIEGEMGDSHVGLQARLMSQALRKLTGIAAKSGVTVIFINQLREKIGVMFGNPETTTGGRALKFYASVRLDIRRIGILKEAEIPIGSKVKIKVVKNKVAPPFKEIESTIYYGKPVSGFDAATAILTVASDHNIIEKSGSWYSYKGMRIGQGLLSGAEFLRNNDDLAQEIFGLVKEKIRPAKTDDHGFDDDPCPPPTVGVTAEAARILEQPPEGVVDDGIAQDGADDGVEEVGG